MLIGICDDETLWCEQAGNIIKNHIGKMGIPAEILYFESERELLALKNREIEVLFLDIRLKERDGIEVAGEINRKWKNCQIVYLTNYLYYATEVYFTEHVFFVLKEQFEKKIDDIFQKVFHELHQKEKKLVFSVIGGKEIVLAPEDIIYFERVKRVTCIETTRGSYQIWDKISDIIEKLPELDFVRCHNSYIVYLPAVEESLKDAFIMKNGMKIMISRSYLKSAREAFMNWALTQIS